jgi:hypothetical protein
MGDYCCVRIGASFNRSGDLVFRLGEDVTRFGIG